MNIMTEERKKRKTELRTRMDYKNVKPQQKDDYKNVKNSSWKKNIFYSSVMPEGLSNHVKPGRRRSENGESGRSA